MPSLNIDFLNMLKDNYNNYYNFIETGTYKGETIINMEPFFKKLYTIEIKKDFYEQVKNNYNGNKINFILGDSSLMLKSLMNDIENSSIIFLDGHWSAENTGKGDKDCPLYEELYNIINFHKENAIVIIDDVRLFGKGPNKGNETCDWEDINIDCILNIVKERLEIYYFLPSHICNDDRLVLHIKKL